MQRNLRARLRAVDLQMNQFRAGQIEWKLGVLKSVFQVPPRHARMFSREDFGAHSLAILNRIYDAAVLIG